MVSAAAVVQPDCALDGACGGGNGAGGAGGIEGGGVCGTGRIDNVGGDDDGMLVDVCGFETSFDDCALVGGDGGGGDRFSS